MVSVRNSSAHSKPSGRTRSNTGAKTLHLDQQPYRLPNILEIGATCECTQCVAAPLHDMHFQIDELQFVNNSHLKEFAWVPKVRLIRAREPRFSLPGRAGSSKYSVMNMDALSGKALPLKCKTLGGIPSLTFH